MKKYLINGDEIVVIEKIKSGFLVAYIAEDGRDEYIDDENPIIVKHVFDRPPTMKHDEIIDTLRSTILQLRKDKQELESSIATIDDENKERIKKYKQYKQLENLDDFLDGKITHYVHLSWNLKIVERDNDKDVDNDSRLLTLFGNSKGDLCWRLNQYSDGSGCNEHVVPCTSYEDALSVMQTHIALSVKDKRPDGSIIRAAGIYDLEINQDYVNNYNLKATETQEEEIKKHQTGIKEAKAKIKKFKS